MPTVSTGIAPHPRNFPQHSAILRRELQTKGAVEGACRERRRTIEACSTFFQQPACYSAPELFAQRFEKALFLQLFEETRVEEVFRFFIFYRRQSYGDLVHRIAHAFHVRIRGVVGNLDIALIGRFENLGIRGPLLIFENSFFGVLFILGGKINALNESLEKVFDQLGSLAH